ncbi:YacL family protein [Escherichia coli]
MEFEFIRNTLMGEYYVKCSMGHEIVGRWLQEEIGKDPTMIAQVEA